MSRPLTLSDPTGSAIEAPGNGIMFAYGDTVPADAATGYSKGCLWVHTDAATAPTTVYINTGSVSSATFRALTPAAQGAALTPALTTITITDAAGTPDYALSALTTTTPYGLATQAEAITLLYVIKNLQTRVGELESRLQAIGLIA